MIHALRVNLISHMATGGQPHNGVYTSYKVHTRVLRLAPWGQGDKYHFIFKDVLLEVRFYKISSMEGPARSESCVSV